MGTGRAPDRRVLQGVRVLVTRGGDDAQRDSAALMAWGANPVMFPVLSIAFPVSWDTLDRALLSLDTYDWLAFTSRNAVGPVLHRLDALGIRIPDQVRVASVGPSTSERLLEGNVRVDLQPATASARALVDAMVHAGVGPGSDVLQAAGDRARPELREELQNHGARVDVVEAYRTVATLDGDVALPDGDVVTLFSPSAFHALLERFGPEPLRGVELACIGPTTARAVRAAGLRADVVAREQSSEGMAAAIADRRTERKTR